MSATDRWTQNVETELQELLGAGSALASDDFWRLLVLLARVAQHPAPPRSLEDLAERSSRVGLTARALAEAERPTSSAVLDALDGALLSGDDPAGPLADALLDLDDLLGVLDLDGHGSEARAVADQAVALLDLAPVPATALDTWALRRLQTLDDVASASALWQAVASASAQAAVQALPAVTHGRPDVDAVLNLADQRGQVIELFSTVPIVRQAWRPAAASVAQAWEPVDGDSWTVYEEDGAAVAQVRAPAGHEAPRIARLVVKVGAATWSRPVRATRRSGRSGWYRLGTERELAAWFSDARTELEVGVGVEVRVSLEWEPDGGR